MTDDERGMLWASAVTAATVIIIYLALWVSQ